MPTYPTRITTFFFRNDSHLSPLIWFDDFSGSGNVDGRRSDEEEDEVEEDENEEEERQEKSLILKEEELAVEREIR